MNRRSALIVEDGATPCTPAAVRALGSAGWDVGLAVSGEPGPSARSRWTRAVHRIPPPETDLDGFVAGIAGAVAQRGYEVAFAADDAELLALSASRARLPCIVPHAPHDAVVRAVDKLELARAAEAAGLRAPETRLATDTAVEDCALPVVVKSRLHWQPGTVSDGRHHLVSVCRTRQEVRDGAAAMAAAGAEPLLQQLVDGELMAVSTVVDREGRAVAWSQQRTLRASLRRTSCRAVTVPLEPDLVAGCERLLASFGWFGIANLQFLRPPGGEPHLIDLNGRLYGSLALAVAAGVNLPDLWGRLALGRPAGPLTAGRPGVGFQSFAEDLRRARRERRGGLLRDLVRVAVDAPRCTHVHADRRDPGPAGAVLASLVRSAAGRGGAHDQQDDDEPGA